MEKKLVMQTCKYVFCAQLGPAIDPLGIIPENVQAAIRAQVRSDITQAAVIPAMLTSGVGVLSGTLADVAAATEPGVPELTGPNPPVPDGVRVLGNGINNAIRVNVLPTVIVSEVSPSRVWITLRLHQQCH